jgi:hypothetical protein
MIQTFISPIARAQDEWVVKKITGSGVACGVVRYGATAVLKGALQYSFLASLFNHIFTSFTF